MRLSKKKLSKKAIIRRTLTVFSVSLFVGCFGFLIYYLVLQPYHSKQVQDKYKAIYYESSYNSDIEDESESENIFTNDNNQYKIKKRSYTLDDDHKKGAKNSKGILLKFSKLLEYNSDTKGWLNIPGTNIDYPVLQAYDGSEFYLTRDFEGNKDKNGSLFIDGNCNVDEPTKNIVIHGHNMDTTKMMFYELTKYKDINFYKEHPVITFDSIYDESKWKIIALLRVSGKNSANDGFNFMQGNFESDEEFLDFLYQIQVRSLYKCPVDVNEDDSLLMLSTCTYEVYNYRTVVVARKVRKDETEEVNTSKAELREDVLYPDSWYDRYEGEPPVVTSFTDALSFDEIDWYDGDVEVDSSIGKTIKFEKSKYKITSPTTLKYMGSTKKNIKSLKIPSTVKINDRKFEVTEISKHAFDDMKKLNYLKIGNKVTEIPSKAFIHCEKLESVIIGDSVKTIGKKAFYKLENLKKIKIRCLKLKTIEEKALDGIAPKAKIRLPKKKFKKYSKLLKEYGLLDTIRIVKYE